MIWEYLEVNCEVFNMWFERGNAERIMHMMQKFLKSEYEVLNIWNKNCGCRKFNIHDFFVCFWYPSMKFRICELNVRTYKVLDMWGKSFSWFHYEFWICNLQVARNTESSNFHIFFISLFFLNINTNYVLYYYCRWFTMEQVSVVLSFSNGSRRMQFTRFRSLFHKKVENVETFSIYKWKYF